MRILRSRKLSAVHLVRLEEILSIFEDITEGLAFLHKKGILHLDLKAENVLLHWEEDSLLPCAKLSDFGSSDSTSNAWSRTRKRTGGSGTVDWLPPEAWDEEEGRPHCPNRANDLWSLGLILHYLAFFALPYRQEDDLQLLAKEIQGYRGWVVPRLSYRETATNSCTVDSSRRTLTRSITALDTISRRAYFKSCGF